MDAPLNASATTAGAMFSNFTFCVPKYQREYAWEKENVTEFFTDLSGSLDEESYFLGLVILTDEEESKQVVDGQQRIITVTLLAAAIYHEAIATGRTALANKISSTFLKTVDFKTDEVKQRLLLSDKDNNEQLIHIVNEPDSLKNWPEIFSESGNTKIKDSYSIISKAVKKSIAPDPFKILGKWATFLMEKLYFAVFIHPDAGSAFKVFEVINTRGEELTTADLLKNYVLSQVPESERDAIYSQWQSVAKQIEANNEASVVQYIRHVITTNRGFILPKDLFDYLANRRSFQSKDRVSPIKLVSLLEDNLALYQQLVDPNTDGPAEIDSLSIFHMLNYFSVITTRPLIMATSETLNSQAGFEFILKLVVRRLVVGSLGTGNVERRLGEAAFSVKKSKDWSILESELADLNPPREFFVERLENRSMNKRMLTFMRSSILQRSITPKIQGTLHIIRPRDATNWDGFSEADAAYLGGTIGNTILADVTSRPKEADSWQGFKKTLLAHSIEDRLSDDISQLDKWTKTELEEVNLNLAEEAADVWYE